MKFQTSYDVKWSLEGGLILEDGKGKYSPAVSLIHELGHKYFQSYNPIGTQVKENELISKDDYDGLDTYFEDLLTFQTNSKNFSYPKFPNYHFMEQLL